MYKINYNDNYLYLHNIVLYLFRCLIWQTSTTKGTKNSCGNFYLYLWEFWLICQFISVKLLSNLDLFLLFVVLVISKEKSKRWLSYNIIISIKEDKVLALKGNVIFQHVTIRHKCYCKKLSFFLKLFDQITTALLYVLNTTP